MACNTVPEPRRRAAPPSRSAPPRVSHRAASAALAVLVVLLALLAVDAPAPLTAVTQAPAVVQLPELDEDTTADIQRDAGRRLDAGGRTIPTTPRREWARPPCERGYVAINDACWLKAAVTPPCPSATWEHNGGCYAPLFKGARPPTSIDP